MAMLDFAHASKGTWLFGGERRAGVMAKPARTHDGPKGGSRTFIETARRAQIVQAAIDTIADLGYANASYA